MSLPIFFYDQVVSANIVTLTEDTSKHIVQVLRMSVGEQIQLCDGKGNLLKAEIVDPHKKKCTVRTIEKKFKPQKAKQVSIGISLLKNASRFEWFLEKASEIGVTDIIPLLCKRTEKQHFRFERMQQIVISAMLQSQQFYLPVLHEPKAFQEVLNTQTFAEKFIAHCEDEQKQQLHSFTAAQSIQILIGPEGDFTKEEIELAKSKDYKPVSLGNTRLRAETAGVVAATILCI